MATKTFAPIRGKRIRVTQLDDCGNLTDTSMYIVTRGFVTVSLTPQVEDGEDIQVRRGDGSFCVNEKGNPTFEGFDVEIEFCDVNPSLLSFVSNAEEYDDYEGDVAGFTVPEGEITGKFALELWTGVAGQDCGDSDAGGYLLLPRVAAGTLEGFEVSGDAESTFTLNNSETEGGNDWGVGPYDVLLDGDGVDAPLPEALDELDHLLMMETFLAPPTEEISPVVVP